MKSFVKFIAFIGIWCVVYLLLSKLFNWGVGLLGEALNLDTLLGEIILVCICSSVMWTILYYPTLLISAALLDKKIYGTFALVIMVLYNLVVLLAFYQLGWVMIIIWFVHAFSTVFPVWLVRTRLEAEELKEKALKEKAYKEQLKAEIIQEMNNGNG